MYMCGSGAQTEQNRSVPHTHTDTRRSASHSPGGFREGPILRVVHNIRVGLDPWV